MSIALTEEHRALADTVRRWAADADVLADTRNRFEEDTEQRPGFLADLAAQGLLGLHLPEEHGGTGYGLAELAVVVEQLGQAGAGGPVVPTMLAGHLIAHHGSEALAKDLLPGIASGDLVGAVEVPIDGRAPTMSLAREGGELVVSGSALVIGGAVADVVLVQATDGDAPTIALLRRDEVDVTELASVDGARRVARVDADAVTVGPDRILDEVSTATVRDLAGTVFAAEAAGLAAWALDTAADYAKVREQFGRPIGSFQAVKHLCADMLVRVEQARAAAWDAARALDEGEHTELAAAVATAVAVEAAVECTKDAIQILGGIGYTWEHDAHFFLKRASSIRSLLGGASAARVRVARLARAGDRRELSIDLSDDTAAQAARDEVRAFLDEIRDLDEAARVDRIADAGYVAPHWPAPYGRDASPIEQVVIDEEFTAAGVAVPDIVIGKWVLPTIIQYGTDEQKERFVGPTYRRDIVWCQMFSEPGAGSDLAALQTKATKVDGGWLLNGQKVWTSVAHESDWGLCLARTNPDAPKHKGITAFLVDMTSDGLDIRPLREITGRAMFNEIYMDDLFVPDDCVVGAVDDGWRAARTTLANERVAMSSGSTMGQGVEGVLAVLDGHPAADDVHVLDQVGGMVCDGQTLALIGFRTTLAQLTGTDPGSGSSVRKLVGMGHAQETAEMALELLGPTGATREPAVRKIVDGYIHARCLTIAGGTTEVQKNVVAERILGLPRDDAR